MSALLLHGHFPSSLERDYVGPLLSESWAAFRPIVVAVRRSGPGTHVYLRHMEAVADLVTNGKLNRRRPRRRAIRRMRREERAFTRKVSGELADIPSVVFVIGLPGAGKSYVRRLLATQLEHRGARVVQLTDYPYLYKSFLEARLGLAAARGFVVGPMGSFELRDPGVLETSFQEFAVEATRPSELDHRVLAEFARDVNLPVLLDATKSLGGDFAVVHVSAPESLRGSRLETRSTEPNLRTNRDGVTIRTSDDHYIPDGVGKRFYRSDDLSDLKRDPSIAPRLIQISTDADSPTLTSAGPDVETLANVIRRL